MSAETAPEARAAAARLYGSGRYVEALKAVSAALREHPQDAALWNVGAGTALALGLPREAERFWKTAIARDPGYAEAHYNLGVLHYRQRAFSAAADCFARAVALSPGNPGALNNLGAVLKELGRPAEAEPLLRAALALDPGNAEAWNNLAQALIALNRGAEARAGLERAIELNPRFAEALTARGRMSAEAGEREAAIADFDAAIAERPHYGEAHQNRALVSRAEPGAAWISRLEAAYAARASLPHRSAVAIHFAMGKVREELGEYAAAFAAYAEGNRLEYAQHPWDEAAEERWLAAMVSDYRSELYAPASPWLAAPPAAAAQLPVFIVGMPRSGTTLIEQVLASHPQVHGAGELATLGGLLAPVPVGVPAPAARPEWIARLRALGEEYRARVWASGLERRAVVDKMPGNYRYLGQLALMLPEARIIHVRRDPLDTCLSCFATPFQDGHEYASELAVLGRQYLRYARLMQHWAAVLPPGRILEVSYEALVADLEGESRRLLSYIGLPWSESCLGFHRTARSVRTASVVQVREPIYSRSIGRWRRFARELESLQALLAPVLPAHGTAPGDVTESSVPTAAVDSPIQVRGSATDTGCEQEPSSVGP